jgi:hypothetical protein
LQKRLDDKKSTKTNQKKAAEEDWNIEDEILKVRDGGDGVDDIVISKDSVQLS